MSKEKTKKYILEQFAGYYGKIFGWRNHRDRARYVHNQISNENSLGSVYLIIKNQISLVEQGIPYDNNDKISHIDYNSKWSKSIKNRGHTTIKNSEYRRVLDRCNSKILEY